MSLQECLAMDLLLVGLLEGARSPTGSIRADSEGKLRPYQSRS